MQPNQENKSDKQTQVKEKGKKKIKKSLREMKFPTRAERNDRQSNQIILIPHNNHNHQNDAISR